MDILKDLTPDMDKLEGLDKYYKIEAHIGKMLAPQDAQTVRPYIYKKTGWGKIERVEARTDGTPTDLTAVRRKKRTRAGEGEVKTGQCWSFAQKNGVVFVPWGGPFGIF